MLSHKQWLALMLGLILVSAPLIKADEEEYDDDDAEDKEDSKGGDDVVVITKDNFDDKVKGSKFALVSAHWWPSNALRAAWVRSQMVNQPSRAARAPLNPCWLAHAHGASARFLCG